MSVDDTRGAPSEAPISLADRLALLGQQTGLSEVLLFRITNGRVGQHVQCLLRYPTEGPHPPPKRSMKRALHLVAETANPFMTLRQSRHRDALTSSGDDHLMALMIAPVLTFDSVVWGALVGTTPDSSATGMAFRSIIQTAEQIGGQISSWGRTRTSGGPVAVTSALGSGMTSSGTLLHELRTPLAASSFALDVIERAPEYSADEQVQRALRTLRLAITEAIRVVQWWGETKERSQAQSNIRPVSIEAALRHSIALVPHLSRLPHVTVAEDTPLALADELMLRRVFVNLIENAFRHGHPGGALDITTAVANGSVQVRFLNEGVIPESTLNLIVGSAHNSTSSSENHSHGYGLGIVKALVNDMHGDVTVDSDWRHWTAFTVTLPAAHPESLLRN